MHTIRWDDYCEINFLQNQILEIHAHVSKTINPLAKLASAIFNCYYPIINWLLHDILYAAKFNRYYQILSLYKPVEWLNSVVIV